MAQADIIIADDKLLPQAVELYNSIFRPKREIDFFKRRFTGRYNATATPFDWRFTRAGLHQPALARFQRRLGYHRRII